MSMTDKMSFCGQCGSERKQDEQFCGQCGHQFQATNKTSQSKIPVSSDSAPPSVVNASKPRSNLRLPGKRFWLLTCLLGMVGIVSLIGFLIVPNLLIQPWPGGKLVDEIKPGETKLREIVDRFGDYDSVGTYSDNYERVTYKPNVDGISELTVWLDSDRTVRWIRVIPMDSPTHKQVRKSLFEGGSTHGMYAGNRLSRDTTLPGETFHLTHGRFTYVVGNEVKEIWKFDTDPMEMVFDIDGILLEMYGDPNRKHDVSGSDLPNLGQ